MEREATKAETERVFAAYAQEARRLRLQARSAAGSTTHPDGIFFGQQADLEQPHGCAPSPARAVARAHVAIIDFHTGLGHSANGELICACRPAPSHSHAPRRGYGDEMTSPEGGTSTSAVVVGI